MTLAWLADHAASTLLMLAAAGVLVRPMTSRGSRVAWVALIGLGAAYGLALNLQPVNFPHSNFDHYYLGAKYPAPYSETYRLFHAGQGLPQIGMRDLDRPRDLVGSGAYDQRAYFIDLLRGEGVPFDALAPLDTLAARARDAGAIEAESRRILAAHLPAQHVGEFRRDMQAAGSMGQGHGLTQDYGYNGSPFYGLLRRADPALHVPFGRWPALLGLLEQLLGVALVVTIAGMALGLSPLEQLAAAALIFASQEFTNFVMPGLVFTELWVPVVVAAWALRHRRAVIAGAAIAVAGAIKLFPFVLLLAAVVPLLGSLGIARRSRDLPPPRREPLMLMASCGVTTLALWLISPVSGRTWPDFLHKIAVEFHSGVSMINSVSASAALVTLGVPDDSPLHLALSLAALLALAAMFTGGREDEAGEAGARRSLALIAATGWLFRGWLNYYMIVPLLLLPWVARRHRVGAAACVAGMAVAYLFPAFDDPALIREPALHLLKLLPYLAIPAWLVVLEWRDVPRGGIARRAAIVTAVLLAAGVGVEMWRGGEIRGLAAAGESSLAASDAPRALASYDRLVKLAPKDAVARRRRAIALASMGRLSEALPDFASAAALASDDAAAHDDYGRALLMNGRGDEAAREIETAQRLAPNDVQILYQLARVRFDQQRHSEAVALLSRARELAPEEPAIAEALRQIGSP